MHYKPPMDEEHCVIAVIILNLRDSATTDKTPLQRLFQYVCLLPKVCVNSGRAMSCPRPYPSRPRHNDATKIRNYLQFDKKRDQPAQPCIAFSYSYCRISHIRIAIKDNSSLGLHFWTFDNPLYVMSMYSLLNFYGILPQCYIYVAVVSTKTNERHYHFSSASSHTVLTFFSSKISI